MIPLRIISANCCAQYKYPFLNPSLSLDKRTGDLLQRLTIDEKLNGWTIYPGEYEIQVGSSSEEIKLTAVISIK